ncbi:MAG: response regulator transcription factor [Oscillospiraceae bacterium]|nr:response regulator transcription factor [Oscillospiraceae bacterium]
MRVLLVEDDETLRETLRQALQRQGYEVTEAATGVEGAYYLNEGGFDVALLDRMLPELDGLTILRRARKKGVATPVLLLTAMDRVGDRVEGLDAGADDYLAKPFATEELLARVRALGRRPAPVELSEVLTFGDLSLDKNAALLHGPKGECHLSKTETRLLSLFLQNGGQPLGRGALFNRVWGPQGEVEEGNLDNYIHLVRRRLSIVGSSLSIRTLWGVGYALEEPTC